MLGVVWLHWQTLANSCTNLLYSLAYLLVPAVCFTAAKSASCLFLAQSMSSCVSCAFHNRKICFLSIYNSCVYNYSSIRSMLRFRHHDAMFTCNSNLKSYLSQDKDSTSSLFRLHWPIHGLHWSVISSDSSFATSDSCMKTPRTWNQQIEKQYACKKADTLPTARVYTKTAAKTPSELWGAKQGHPTELTSAIRGVHQHIPNKLPARGR